MVSMPEQRLERAIELAAQNHAEQVDKAGEPYILHCLRVMLKMQSEDECIVAVLHDILEDTIVMPFQIESLFGPEIAAAIDSITRRDGEPYFDYIRRCSKNALAARVKVADLNDNLDPKRHIWGASNAPQLESLRNRYESALKMLSAAAL